MWGVIKILGKVRNNYSEAERLYVKKFPDRRHPSRKTIKRLSERAGQDTLKRISQKSGPNEVTSLAVVDTVALSP